MSKHRTKIVVSIATILLIAAGLLAFAPVYSVSGSSSPGYLVIGDEPPGGDPADFVDGDGKPYYIRLIATEYEDGGGQVTLLLDGAPDGGPLRLCTAQGPGVYINFDAGPVEGNYYDLLGNFPFDEIRCGTAHEMSVAIDGCQADIEFHGYVHSDYPFVTYMGMMTTTVSFKNGEENELEIKIYTPKEEIELEGIVSGNVECSE